MRQTSRSGRRSALTVGEVRASIVHDELLGHPELVERAEDIACLPRIAHWPAELIAAAVDVLVADGLITEDAIGRLIIAPRRDPVRDQLEEIAERLRARGGLG